MSDITDIDRTRAVFIKEGTPLPTTLLTQSEAFVPGWRVVTNLDRQALTREIEGANWHLFNLAGETKAVAFGRNRLGSLRRAVSCVLAKQQGQKFNALEITNLVSKRFLGIPFVTVTVHARHIQQGVGLVPAKDFVLRMPVAAAPESTQGGGGNGIT